MTGDPGDGDMTGGHSTPAGHHLSRIMLSVPDSDRSKIEDEIVWVKAEPAMSLSQKVKLLIT